MKIIKIVAVSIIGLIVVVFIGAFIFIKTIDVNKYIPQITQQISKAINRPVTINHLGLDLSLTKGLSLSLQGLAIKDDPNFSSTDFLDVKEASLGLDIMPLILQREIHITNIVITSPQISVVRSSDGKINAQTMTPEPAASTSTPSAPAPSSAASSSNPVAALPALLVKSIVVENAQVSFEDKNTQMPLHVVLSEIDAKIDDFSLTKSFNFAVHANVWGKNQKNVQVTGACTLDLAQNGAHVSNLKITSDLSQWDWAKVKTVTTILQNVPVWPQEVKGQVNIDVPQLDASAKGLGKLSMHASLSDGYVQLKELLNPIKNINIQMDSDLNDLNLKSLKANAGSGEINAEAHVRGLLTTQAFDAQLETKGINIDELLDESSWPAVLKGALNSQFSISGQTFAPETMMSSLKGDGSFAMTNAKIEKLNILQTVLGKLNFIPGLSNQIEAAMDSTLKDKLNTDTTILDKAEGKIKIQDKVVSIENGDIESKLFMINAQGKVGFDMTTDIAVAMYLASDVSAALIKSARPLQGLLDDQQRLYIPGKVSGKIPSVGYMPDINYISKKALTAEGSEQINKQLDKVFKKNPEVGNLINSFLGGGQKEDTTTTNSETNQTNQTNQTQDQNSADQAKKAVNNLLNKFLH